MVTSKYFDNASAKGNLYLIRPTGLETSQPRFPYRRIALNVEYTIVRQWLTYQ
jgi:hypothetical protein